MNRVCFGRQKTFRLYHPEDILKGFVAEIKNTEKPPSKASIQDRTLQTLLI